MTDSEWQKFKKRRSFSPFRMRFHLSEKDKEYVKMKGYETIEKHAREFITKRLAPANPANDGKIVIVCGELKVLEPAYDDELGLTIYAPRAMRSAKKMKLKKWNLPATEENMEWNSDLGVGGMEIFQGAADVGDYHLSEEFIEQLMLGREYEFDEETLSEAGLAILTDRKYRGEKFIGTQRMGREIFEEGDRRYQYSVPYQSDGDMVTVIGIQEQGTLTYVKGATPNMLSGELDKKTALKKGGMTSGGVSIFRVVLTILLLSTGIRMLLKKRDQKEDGSGL